MEFSVLRKLRFLRAKNHCNFGYGTEKCNAREMFARASSSIQIRTVDLHLLEYEDIYCRYLVQIIINKL